MVISKWITINLSWKQFVPLSVWSGFLRCWLFRIQGKRVLQQASRAERPLPGLLPTCAHSSYEGAKHVGLRRVTAAAVTGLHSWQVQSGRRTSKSWHAIPARHRLQAAQGLAVTLGEWDPIASARELCHRSPGWRLGMNSAYADAVTFWGGSHRTRKHECHP